MSENIPYTPITVVKRSFFLFFLTNTALRIHQLTLTSLLATVPILTIVLGILSFTPALNVLKDNLFAFLETHLVPGSSEVLTPYLIGFSEQAKSLPIAGSIMLVIAALLLLNNFESSVQAIWQIKKTRNLKDRLLTYWAILTLGPILLGLLLSIYAKVLSLQWQGLEIANGLINIINIGSFLLYFIFLFILNYLTPNTQVKFKYALVSSLIGTIGILLVNFTFSFFTSLFYNYQVVYGAFAALPAFIIWLQCVWGAIFISVCVCAVLHSPFFEQNPVNSNI